MEADDSNVIKSLIYTTSNDDLGWLEFMPGVVSAVPPSGATATRLGNALAKLEPDWRDWEARLMAMVRTGERQPESFADRSWETSAPIDFAHLRRYTLGDEAVEREVLQLFVGHVPVIMAELKAASSDKAWRDAAHSLKGSALSLGAWKVARGAVRAEAAGRNHREAADIIADLERSIEEVRRLVAGFGAKV